MTLTELRDLRFPTTFSRMKLAEALKLKYPDIQWDKVYLLRGKFAQQKRLERALQRIFPVSNLFVSFLLFSFLLRFLFFKNISVLNSFLRE